MEHAQRACVTITSFRGTCDVLILILMEHAQRGGTAFHKLLAANNVLILILMEHAQREYKDSTTYDLDEKS